MVALLGLATGCAESAFIGLRELDREDDGRGVELSFRGEGSILLQAENGWLAPRPLPPSAMDEPDAMEAGSEMDAGNPDAGPAADAGAAVGDDSSDASDDSNGSGWASDQATRLCTA